VVSWIAVILLAAGLSVSVLHLGKPTRLLLALSRGGRSRLSNEVILAGILLPAALAALLLRGRGMAEDVLWGLVAAASPALLIFVGWVYHLPGQLSWKGPAALSPLLLGTAFGAAAEAVLGEFSAAIMALAMGAIALDAAGFALRWIRLNWDAEAGMPAYPAIFQARRRLLFLRLLDANLLPAGLLLAEMPLAASFVLSIGIWAERYAFYALALKQTPEAEIAQVMRVLRSL
jgi:DMSO reductase anchor subunit